MPGTDNHREGLSRLTAMAWRRCKSENHQTGLDRGNSETRDINI